MTCTSFELSNIWWNPFPIQFNRCIYIRPVPIRCNFIASTYLNQPRPISNHTKLRIRITYIRRKPKTLLTHQTSQSQSDNTIRANRIRAVTSLTIVHGETISAEERYPTMLSWGTITWETLKVILLKCQLRSEQGVLGTVQGRPGRRATG